MLRFAFAAFVCGSSLLMAQPQFNAQFRVTYRLDVKSLKRGKYRMLAA